MISYERCQNKEKWTTRGQDVLLTSLEFGLAKSSKTVKLKFCASRFRCEKPIPSS